MPDREKVMAGLVTCIAACNGKTVCLDCWYMHDYSGGCETQLLSDALALLKAQEPVRVAVMNNSITGLPVTHCPKCHESIDMFYAAKGIETKFCPWCGQAVKWE